MVQEATIECFGLKKAKKRWPTITAKVCAGSQYRIYNGLVMLGCLVGLDALEPQIWEGFPEKSSAVFRDSMMEHYEKLGGDVRGYVITFHRRPRALFVSPELAKEQGILREVE